MPKGKDLTHLGREMERAWDERRSRSSSPVSRPALPRGRSRSPVATRFTRVRQSIDVEYEWSVLWSGAEKMYHATSATNRNAGWQRFESAAEILRRHMADLTTAAQAVPKTEDIAAELVRQLNQSQSPPCDPVEIARTVAGMMTARPRTPPVINMAELARLISENLKIERAPPYSPIVDVTRITNLVEERLEAKQKAAAQHPTSLSETAEVSELTADLPPLRLSTSSTSEDESTTVVQPATITPIEQSASTSTTRPAATAKASRKSDRRCLACGKARAHNSRLWCEACRMFLVRAKKAAETDKPYTCVVTSHNNKPDTTNCRGCRLRKPVPTTTVHCDHVSIKLPKFLPFDPEAWFFNVDAQFELRHVTVSETKVNHLLSVLEPQHIKEILDVLRNPETAHNYDAIKTVILKRFGDSEEDRLNKLLGPLALGDMTPSQLLREIQRLAGSAIPQNILRGIWVKRLPTSAQQILQATEGSSLEKQAEIADKILSIHVPQVASTSFMPQGASSSSFAPQVAAVSSSTLSLESLSEQLKTLTATVNHLDKIVRSRDRSRGRSRHRDATPSHSQSGVCRYHNSFGANARRCITPCTFQPTNNQGNSKNVSN
ncbi:hypothetical protein GE061_007945 [Apolygus lucorum]|uniref:DUF7041 domain-containing protein n=1 Tax=Apolygus lucorum TaxID=248454 RepID=A0A6A4IY38_APOLU|nr:hypothetical protein GE061_007945 [Apolygus lucorum]